MAKNLTFVSSRVGLCGLSLESVELLVLAKNH